MCAATPHKTARKSTVNSEVLTMRLARKEGAVSDMVVTGCNSLASFQAAVGRPMWIARHELAVGAWPQPMVNDRMEYSKVMS